MPPIFKSLQRAAESYGSAWPMLWQKEYRAYRWAPLFIQLLLLVATVWLAMQYATPLTNYLLSTLDINPAPEWSWVQQVLAWLLRIMFFLAYFSVLKYITLIAMTPFLTVLSERVEYRLSGKSYPFSAAQVVKDVGRAVVINTYNLAAEMLLTVALFAFTLIPVVGWLAPFLILLVQSYFFGFSLLDFNAERWRMSFKDTRRWMWRHKVYVTSHGLIFHFLFLIPVLGWIYAPVWSTMAGTKGFLKWQTGLKKEITT